MKNKNNNYKIVNICCIGAGYVGGPTMAVLAKNCPEVTVNVVDLNEERINKWNDDSFLDLPVFEPGLPEVIKSTRNKNLFFSTNVDESISKADMIFLSVNTPTKKKGLGAGKASDLKWIEACARQIAYKSKGHTIVVEKSTVPVKTAETIKTILSESFPKEEKTFSVLSNPEFLAEGTAINDLQNPDRVLIGGEDEESIETLTNLYKSWIPEDRIIKTNLWSSELSKLISNAFLAQRVSSINSISALCEATGADIRQVANSIGTDSRVGSKFLNSGPGFGGSCFQKDILNLVYLCEYFGLSSVASYWENVISINNWQRDRIYKTIVSKLFGNLQNKKIAILGFAFKPETNDTRESSAISICKNLLNEGALLQINDPKVKESDIFSELISAEDKNLDLKNNINFSKQIYKTFEDADATVLLTDWDNYKNLNWEKISKLMRKPAWVFDTRLILDKSLIKEVGLNFWGLGLG